MLRWDQNPGLQDGRHRRIHRAMAAAPGVIEVLNDVCNRYTVAYDDLQLSVPLVVGNCHLLKLPFQVKIKRGIEKL